MCIAVGVVYILSKFNSKKSEKNVKIIDQFKNNM